MGRGLVSLLVRLGGPSMSARDAGSGSVAEERHALWKRDPVTWRGTCVLFSSSSSWFFVRGRLASSVQSLNHSIGDAEDRRPRSLCIRNFPVKSAGKKGYASLTGIKL
ncbi:unnamed protein product [Notodromas monacha]|uniref:Uncharacterized protein n=1 Tax=Notodromas monacha TaxID=399045 RepID=A0A7R9BGV8_9CRUS|nr:unnamed protein product [Notodromas monacha]CAG0914535.1 unnamed protein product [Notodromas monacha]